MVARVHPGNDRVDDAGRAVDDVERRMETVLGSLRRGEFRRVLMR